VPTRRGPSPGGQWWDTFDFSEFEPPRTVSCGPRGTVDCPDLDRPRPFAKHYLGIETLSNDAMNAVWIGDMLEYETNWTISCGKP
jgi:hypothetical protein